MATAARQAGALRLHLNENTAGCSPAVIEALRALTPADVATYPDYDALTARLARWLGVAPASVIVTNGLDEGLYAVAQYGGAEAPPLRTGGGAAEPGAAGLQPCHGDASQPGAAGLQPRRGDTCRAQFLQVDPAFEMFEEFTRIVGADLVRVSPGPDFAFPLETVLAAIGPATRVVYLVDPNNPTGIPLPDGAVDAIAAAAPQALVLVDEAYADFSGRTAVGGALDRHANVVVGRTFAKGHGLAGLRIGALVAQPDTAARLRTVLPPFNVNVAAVAALTAALDDEAHLRWTVAQAAESRSLIEAFCRRHGLTCWPSVANFVLVRVGPSAAAAAEALARRGILVRDKSAAPGCFGCLRITAGVVAHTTATLTALEDILATRPN